MRENPATIILRSTGKGGPGIAMLEAMLEPVQIVELRLIRSRENSKDDGVCRPPGLCPHIPAEFQECRRGYRRGKSRPCNNPQPAGHPNRAGSCEHVRLVGAESDRPMRTASPSGQPDGGNGFQSRWITSGDGPSARISGCRLDPGVQNQYVRRGVTAASTSTMRADGRARSTSTGLGVSTRAMLPAASRAIRRT